MIARRLRGFLAPVSRQLPRIRAAARVAAQPNGLALLLRSRYGRTFQTDPDVYQFAGFVAEKFGCTTIVFLGQPTARELVHLLPNFQIEAIARTDELDNCRSLFPCVVWHPTDFNGAFSLSEGLLRRSLIICPRRVDEASDPRPLLASIRSSLQHAPACLLTATKREIAEVEVLLRENGIDPLFVGLTASDNLRFEKSTVLAVLQNHRLPRPFETIAPPEFRVVAFMAAYNEEDIIVESIRKWTDQGVRVHIIENWSTDATYDLITAAARHLPVTFERFPREGPSESFDWAPMLQRIEDLTHELEADWFVRRGADEILSSPWPGVTYREALYLVDRAGFNCVDHTILEFHPVDNNFQPGTDHEAYFRHFDFKGRSHHWQRKAWKNCGGAPASSIKTAGHDVSFEGRRIYPFKFLLKHYSFRSQAHGEKKVFRERKPRWNSSERARGWHIHYDSLHEGHQFLQSTSEKELFDAERFDQLYLVERLSGIGTDRHRQARDEKGSA